jgi:hypothetical protein
MTNEYTWARQYATTRMVANTLTNIAIFYLTDPSSHTVDLGWILPLTEMSSRNNPGDRSAACT